MTTETQMVRVEPMRLADVKPAKRNPKAHDLDEIDRSFERFGFTLPLLYNEKTKSLSAGHGRLEALLRRKGEGKKPPDRIDIDDDGEWIVPVIRGLSFRNRREAEAYLVADNRLTELGGWRRDLLADLLADLQEHDALDGIGYSTKDVDDLLESIKPREPDAPEAFPEFDGSVSTAYCCPKCGYEWNGLPK